MSQGSPKNQYMLARRSGADNIEKSVCGKITDGKTVMRALWAKTL
jgi:hypothetical protein